MMSGRVTPELEAVIVVPVGGPQGEKRDIEFLIDTGFNGFLTLPTAWIDDMALPFDGYAEGTLADGQAVLLPFFEGVVTWNNATRSVIVLEADGDPLLGMALLSGFTLEMEVIKGGMVRVKPVEDR
jgi:clan AA aspartic protease